jgi:hypothetical protein
VVGQHRSTQRLDPPEVGEDEQRLREWLRAFSKQRLDGDGAERPQLRRTITVASGKKKVVKARFDGNRHLADACDWWAFCTLTHSAGARRYYDELKAKGNDLAL